MLSMRFWHACARSACFLVPASFLILARALLISSPTGCCVCCRGGVGMYPTLQHTHCLMLACLRAQQLCCSHNLRSMLTSVPPTSLAGRAPTQTYGPLVQVGRQTQRELFSSSRCRHQIIVVIMVCLLCSLRFGSLAVGDKNEWAHLSLCYSVWA